MKFNISGLEKLVSLEAGKISASLPMLSFSSILMNQFIALGYVLMLWKHREIPAIRNF